jgi:hypothetical protein
MYSSQYIPSPCCEPDSGLLGSYLTHSSFVRPNGFHGISFTIDLKEEYVEIARKRISEVEEAVEGWSST